MPLPWRQTCLLFALLAMPVAYAAFCVRASRRRPGRLLSYFTYYLLFGFVGQWLLAAVLWPSALGRTMLGFLLTAAPAACLGLGIALQRGPGRAPFDTGAMFGCYLYLALSAGAACVWLGFIG